MQRAFFLSRIVAMRIVDVLRVLNIQNTAFLCSIEMANLEQQARRPRLRLREIDPMGACIIVFDAALTPWRVKSVPKAIQRSQG